MDRYKNLKIHVEGQDEEEQKEEQKA